MSKPENYVQKRFGTETIDTWDQYVEQMNSLGLTEVLFNSLSRAVAAYKEYL